MLRFLELAARTCVNLSRAKTSCDRRGSRVAITALLIVVSCGRLGFDQNGKGVDPTDGGASDASQPEAEGIVVSSVIVDPLEPVEHPAYGAARVDEGWLTVGTREEVGGANIEIIRFTDDGAHDLDFGDDGFRILSAASSEFTFGYAVAVSQSGRLYLAGDVLVGAADAALAVALTEFGEPIDSFGQSSSTTVMFSPQSDTAVAAAPTTDGGVVICGTGGYDQANPQSALARFNEAGEAMATFGSAGRLVIDMGAGDDRCFAALEHPDGSIYFGGFFAAGGYVAKTNANGTLDASFGVGGVVTLEEGSIRALKMHPNGRVLGVGSIGGRVSVLGFNGVGLDAAFGVDGEASLTDVVNSLGASLVVQSNGKIVVGGRFNNAAPRDALIARFLEDGNTDEAFGDGGQVVLDVGGSDDVRAVTLTEDGRIGAVGTTVDNDDISHPFLIILK